jgi:hypothetical protein
MIGQRLDLKANSLLSPKFLFRSVLLATILQVAGCAIISIGVGLLLPALGVIVAGVAIVLFGLAVEGGK